MDKRIFTYCLGALAAAILVISALVPAQAGRRGCDLDDFYWYIEDVKLNGIPRGAKIITDKSKIAGAWKCLVEHDPQDKRQEAAAQYALINIAINGNSVKLCFDPLRIKFAREADFIDQTRVPDSIFKGQWKNGGADLLGPGRIRLTKFYSKGRHQYAIGEGMQPDGSEDRYALVRP